MRHTYRTLQGYSEYEMIINKSRFIAQLSRAESEAEAIDFIDKIKKKHWNATHNCSAYVIGENNHHQKANDDGEPSGTAGKPMLETLKNMEIEDAVVVVTRYFGGTKLGAGGLIRAYGKATSEGIRHAPPIERVQHERWTVRIDYTHYGKLENLIQTEKYPITDSAFTADVAVTILLPLQEETSFQQAVQDIAGGTATFEKGTPVYVDNPVNV